MSLFVPADGILKTHLTWEELQKSVFKVFGDHAEFGPNKNVKDIGIGNGVMSRICLISPDWQTEHKNLPRNFVVKICSQLSLVENKAIMENSDVFNEEMAKQMEAYVKRNHDVEVRFYELLKKYGVTDIPTPKRCASGPSKKELPKSLGMEPVLCHGDLWATNLIWKNNKSEPVLEAVIDFQNVHFGCPNVDFVRIFSACMSGKDRKDHWESLLEKFYKYLKVELDGHNMPYTLDMVLYTYLCYDQ
ncbi:hypothetical protein GCK32_014517 [Trichostrongylus colubriformis]|uniref:CHK kinase-like domain-containing protein n=1 Tax=Trichostrongylus colubriformis TaxID=6319 RepID=A0AAN8F960_TRICO